MLVEVDLVDFDDAMFFFEDHNIEVREAERVGPAGGNPRFFILIDTKEKMEAFTEFYFGNE